MSESPSARVARDQLKAFIERIERLEEEAKAIADDKRDVYAEAKAHGFDTRALRVIVKKRKLDQEERLNQESLIETYMVALGMGWGKSEEGIDAALDKRRTEAGKAKTARGREGPPRAQACAAKRSEIASQPARRLPQTIKGVVAAGDAVIKQHRDMPPARAPQRSLPSYTLPSLAELRAAIHSPDDRAPVPRSPRPGETGGTPPRHGVPPDHRPGPEAPPSIAADTPGGADDPADPFHIPPALRRKPKGQAP